MSKREELMRFYQTLERAEFIDDWSSKVFAEVDSALPIECGQTISQPSLVLKMTDLLDLHREEKVLEIGTGSGYQTAFLSAFAKRVFTVERFLELSLKAAQRLSRLGFCNVDYKVGDGSEGWAEHAPFERIIVTAAASAVPEELLDQLAIGGRMVLPVGPKGWQELLLVEKNEAGSVSTTKMGSVAFVELVGRYGWET